MEKKQLKKLVLNKEHIAHLSNTEMKNVLGGGSTEHDFTCGLCTNLDGGGSGPQPSVNPLEPSITLPIPVAPNTYVAPYAGPGGGGITLYWKF